MKWLIIVLLFLPFQNFANDNFSTIRKNLAIAPENKSVCYAMLSSLEKNKENVKSVGYLGAFTMIKANHQLNPIKKLGSFNDGKKLLEKAIAQSPNDIELRYVRYAIQISIPKSLGYNAEISEDKKMLQDFKTTKDVSLQKDIKELLKVKLTK
ncbi:hypothetical protein [Sphingobacterium cavernae]|uniref:hypothetical protein n=1 Tax=Sphingobacterium cavernae TaxID=2592657 RepID=UPI0012301BAF|nr:hypothetical protein [Sphingobacterium cavernae]